MFSQEFTMNWKNSILNLTGRDCYMHVAQSFPFLKPVLVLEIPDNIGCK